MEMILCLNCGDMYKNNGNNNKECIICHSKNIKNMKNLNFTIDDYFQLLKISEDGNFIYEMLKLKNDNPIEYQLKLQKLQSTSQQSNIPKCPTCQSTNIKKIGAGERVTSVLGLGLFSKKINKTWKCNNCGHTW